MVDDVLAVSLYHWCRCSWWCSWWCGDADVVSMPMQMLLIVVILMQSLLILLKRFWVKSWHSTWTSQLVTILLDNVSSDLSSPFSPFGKCLSAVISWNMCRDCRCAQWQQYTLLIFSVQEGVEVCVVLLITWWWAKLICLKLLSWCFHILLVFSFTPNLWTQSCCTKCSGCSVRGFTESMSYLCGSVIFFLK